MNPRRCLTLLASTLLLVLLVGGTALWVAARSPTRGLPYHSAFSQKEASDWVPFGGSWSVQNGAMRNSSDERGAKLITGSKQWSDVVLEADLRFLGTGGDAGLLVRSSKEEAGVDAFDGYYAGLRSFDNSLVLGRADFGWSEARPVPLPSPIQPLAWYHIRVVALGCRLAASASDPVTRRSSFVALEEQHCAPAGHIGLRSVATGGEWRNVSVRRATATDMLAMLREGTFVGRPLYPRTEAEYSLMESFRSPRPLSSGPATEPIESLASLRLQPRQTARVRGVVTLLRPELVIQDATAGVVVHTSNSTSPTLNVGDEVEVEGVVEPAQSTGITTFALQRARVRLLWDRSPVSAVSVTALQASTQEFAGLMTETQGEVVAQHEEGSTIVLDLVSDTQRFQAIVDKPLGGLRILSLPLHGIVRVRGICMPDVRYTHRLTPFVLLLPSSNDLEVIAGPPWWTARQLLQRTVLVLLLLLLAQAYHTRMQRQRRTAITEERERLAHELHDTLAQSFAGVAFHLHGIRNRLRLRGRAELQLVEQQLDTATDFVRRTHQEASLSIAMLRAQSVEISDLAKSLERRAADLAAPGVVQVQVTGDGQGRPVPLRTTDAFLHVGLEALANAARHSGADRITITLCHDKERLSLEISDNGVGFARDPACQRMGLKGMERRAGMIHAQLQIRSNENAGTCITLVAASARRFWPWSLEKTA